jgi:uncharacterized repeat protein (TIGR03803 family)
VYEELYSFGPHPDGGGPQGGLVQGNDGNFYGTTYYGGAWDFGTVFRITPNGSLSMILAFDGSTVTHPIYSLMLARDGNFYGSDSRGDVFGVTPDGVLTFFGGGGGPLAGELIQGTNNYFYGVATADSSSYGFVFSEAPDLQSGQVLHEFTYGHAAQDGIYPEGGLIQASDGYFYGTTSGGGVYGCGTVYRMTPDGQLTTIASFNNANCGATYPAGRLLQGSDGNLYGTADGCSRGTTFKVTLTGILTTLHLFDFLDGQNPNGGLIEGNDGSLYGTAPYGGSSEGVGTVFRLSAGGTVSALVAFTGQRGTYPGANPYAGLVQASDGNLYGTTGNQGSHGYGNVFRIIMPGPQLSISHPPSTSKQVVLSWRTNYTGFKLQASTDFSPGVWLDRTSTPFVSGGQFFVTNSLSAGAQFFRLKK